MTVKVCFLLHNVAGKIPVLNIYIVEAAWLLKVFY